MDIYCFLSFDVHPDFRRLLAFELGGSYYHFKRLPFGLSSAPWWCKQFLAVVDFAFRQAGLSHVLLVGPSAAVVQRAVDTARRILTQHDPAINTEGPTQRITFLWLGLDSVQQVMFVPDDKVNDISGDGPHARWQLHHQVDIAVPGRYLKLSFVAKVLPGAHPFFRSATMGMPHPYTKQAISAHVKEGLRI
jgi:hypothetical protein